MRPVGLLDRLRWADSDGRLGCSGLALAGLVIALVVEDTGLWGRGFVPVRYRRLAAESGYSRSTVARRLPVVLQRLAAVGVVDYRRRPGEAYRVRLVVELDVLQRWGVAWVPWPLADASHRLHPGGWSHTDRARAAAWWSFANWNGDINGAVGVEGLAARVGLRPSTLKRGPTPEGLWSDPGKCLSVSGWSDAGLGAHRRDVRYEDYRCAVAARSGREGASVRRDEHVPNSSAALDGFAEDHSGADLWERWGGLIDGSPNPVDTTTNSRTSSAASFLNSGEGIEDHNQVQRPAGGTCGPARRRTRRTPDRWRYEAATTSARWEGPAPEHVRGLARRFGWHVAEQAALETHRVVTLGRPVRSAKGLATHFAVCFARPGSCSGQHSGPCGRLRLDQHRARRLDEEQDQTTANLNTSVRNPTRTDPTVEGAAAARTGKEDRPADPAAALAEAAKDASPRLRALAARVSKRFASTTPDCIGTEAGP